MQRLKEKIAIITGAAQGIGLAYAKAYIREGATVVIADINEAEAKKIAVDLGDQAIACYLDVTSIDSINQCVQTVLEQCGGIDILINNAAVFDLAPISEITEESYQRLFQINVYGTLFMMQAVAKVMIETGTKGHIINMASQAGRRGESLVAVYCASKAAVISLTQSAGLNLIKHGINVNAIAPGVVDGQHWQHVDELFAKAEGLAAGEKKAQVAKEVPFGRMGAAEDLTGMAIFLASKESEYIVAQTYNVDGGNWMS